MDRYAVIDKNGVVINIIVWDGVSNWKPPEGCRVERDHDLYIGDIWMPSINDFVRPLKNAKTPEDPVGIEERQKTYMEAKQKFQASILFVKPNETLEA